MDYDSVAKAKSMLGSGGVVVIAEGTCMVAVAERLMRFYAHESCGWCIPCREARRGSARSSLASTAGWARRETSP